MDDSGPVKQRERLSSNLPGLAEGESGALPELVIEAPPAAEPCDPLIGQTIGGHYHILDQLGQGGMSAVYKARHTLLHKTMALKIILPQKSLDSTSLKRFQQEAKIVSRLEHPNIVKLQEFGIATSGHPYLVMPLVEGVALSDLICQEGALPPQRAVSIARQICEALAHSHESGIIHRDLKPSNIILTRTTDGDDFANIIDFGIAKQVTDESVNFTQTGEVIGSPHYMSPEQVQGLSLDERSDIYALGCVMYEMLTGKPPFQRETAMQVLFAHVDAEPPPMPERFNIPAPLQRMVLKCLAKQPSQRPRCMRELKQSLEAGGIGTLQFLLGQGTSKRSRHVSPVSFILLCLVAGLLAVIAGLWPEIGPAVVFYLHLPREWAPTSEEMVALHAVREAETLFAQGKLELARARLKAMVESGVFSRYCALMLANICAAMGNYQEAETVLQKLGADDITMGHNLRISGVWLEKADRNEAAENMFKRALHHDLKCFAASPQSVGKDYYNIAVSLQKQGHAQRAIPCYQLALPLLSRFLGPNAEMTDACRHNLRLAEKSVRQRPPRR